MAQKINARTSKKTSNKKRKPSFTSRLSNLTRHKLFLPLAAVIIFSVVGASYILFSSAATLNSTYEKQVSTEQGCWLAGRVYDANASTNKCTNKCRVSGAVFVARDTAKDRPAYCKGHVAVASDTMTEEVCIGRLHRWWLNNLGCARKADQENHNEAKRFCPNPAYPNYIAQSDTDRCVADTIVNQNTSNTDPLTKENCQLLGRTWDATKNACNRTCVADGGTLLKDDKLQTFYCQSAVWTNVAEQRCAELHRKWLGVGCARRTDQKDTNNALQCVAGYPYYNANFKPTTGNPTLIDVCEKNERVATQNEQQGLLGGVQVGNTSPDNPSGNPDPNNDENGDESGVGDGPTDLPAGWTRKTTQAACNANGRIWDDYLKACSWREQGEQRSDACKNNAHTYVKRAKANDVCISSHRVTSIVKHAQFKLHDAVCKIPGIKHRQGCQNSTDGDDSSSLASATKILVIVEENHSLGQMREHMPYAFSKAKQYGYATDYSATVHPSLGNYIAIAAGDNLGVSDDAMPPQHRLQGRTVFGAAIENGKTAKIYAEGMKGNCAQDNQGSRYLTRHNPWTYFVDEREMCNKYDVPMAKNFDRDVAKGELPNVGMLVPNSCNDAHDVGRGCDLATADRWFKTQFEKITNGPDWKSGKLIIVLTADEDEKGGEKNPGPNKVLTAVFHKSLDSKVVDRSLNHYSLSGFMSEVAGVRKLRNADQAPNMLKAFGGDAPDRSSNHNSPDGRSQISATFSFQNVGYVEKSSPAVFEKIKQSLGDRSNVVYNFTEIDEGDNGEHDALKKTFGDKGWSQFTNGNPTLNRMSDEWTMTNSDRILLHKGGSSSNDFRGHGCPTPDRYLIVTQLAKKDDPDTKLAVINTHFITHAYNQPSYQWCQQWWDLSWNKLKDKVATLHANGFDVVVTGDLNHSGNLPFLHAGTQLVAHHGPDRILAIPGPNRRVAVERTGIVDTPSGESFHKNLWAHLTFSRERP